MSNAGEWHNAQISDGLFNDILERILMGDYPPQSKLPTEQSLASIYGVSRATVRSALARLKYERVIQSRQGSGTIVACFDPGVIARLNRDARLPSLKECFACRLAIEPAIAATVAQNSTNELRAFLENQRTVLENGDKGDEYERCARDVHFHMTLAEFSQNTFFVSIMNTLRPHIIFAMNISKRLTRGAQRDHFNLSRIEHLKIIEAISQNDPQKAQSVMRLHIKNGGSRIFGPTFPK
ncbi:MAG: GntR family transcriptional repressor for pyruvate dehydrogenase complex [Paracoccaceae bacterium]|jgi:GntR family transcriptional repressor for pyruvate dehydrogenase complex